MTDKQIIKDFVEYIEKDFDYKVNLEFTAQFIALKSLARAPKMAVTDDMVKVACGVLYGFAWRGDLGNRARNALEAVFAMPDGEPEQPNHYDAGEAFSKVANKMKESEEICKCPLEKRGVGCLHIGMEGVYCDRCSKLHPDYLKKEPTKQTVSLWEYLEMHGNVDKMKPRQFLSIISKYNREYLELDK